ncbi:MAG TPA: long-chain fatty acid--CoA ligase, partial [Agrobacterium sp.]|nr:long-chain fatty acid--CoA ligase [Agrobacterium sp.]
MSELSLGQPENVSVQKRWLSSYPQGVPAEIPSSAYSSLVELLEKSCLQFADRKAFSSMGKSLTYRELDIETRAVAAWLQSRGLEKGDRVAVMMPNILQNPVAVY